MKFSDIKGSPLIHTILKNAIKAEAYANAYMFVGPTGVGRFTTAKAFAKFANCSETEDLCDVCPSCLKIELGNHPDFYILEPIDGMIKIDQIRQLQRSFSYAVYEGKQRFAIIDSAHLMTEDAANCLLKTLEEPPARSSIILICPSVHSVLPTIVSRCQVYNFNSVTDPEIKDYLHSTYSLDDKAADFITYLSAGSIGKCNQYVQDTDLMKRREFYSTLFFRMFNEIPYGLMSTIAELNQQSLIELFEYWLFLTSDAINLKKGRQAVNSDYTAKLVALSFVDEQSLTALLNLCKEAIHNVGGNINIKIQIEYFSAYCLALKRAFNIIV